MYPKLNYTEPNFDLSFVTTAHAKREWRRTLLLKRKGGGREKVHHFQVCSQSRSGLCLTQSSSQKKNLSASFKKKSIAVNPKFCVFFFLFLLLILFGLAVTQQNWAAPWPASLSPKTRTGSSLNSFWFSNGHSTLWRRCGSRPHRRFSSFHGGTLGTTETPYVWCPRRPDPVGSALCSAPRCRAGPARRSRSPVDPATWTVKRKPRW